ncbi:hypothetical protein BHE74_00020698 [Ensete ventricosum]|nr:hypothetical protein BHE74_00020698 [Ensete ventricosum]
MGEEEEEEEEEEGEAKPGVVLLFPCTIRRPQAKNHQCDPSPVGNFFSQCGEKKRLPAWGEGMRRLLPGSGQSTYRSASGPVRTARYGALPFSKENLGFLPSKS